MALLQGTTGSIRSELVDLSGIALDELEAVSGLSDALALLQGKLAHSAAPLCEGNLAAMCGGAAWTA